MSQKIFNQTLLNAPFLESERDINQIEVSNSVHEYKFVLNCKNIKKKSHSKKIEFGVRNSKFGVNRGYDGKCSSDLKRKSKVKVGSSLYFKGSQEIIHITRKGSLNLNTKNSNNLIDEGNILYDTHFRKGDFNNSDLNVNESSNSFLPTNMFKRVGSLFECQLCYKQLKESSKRQHCITHAGLKPFSCNFCNSRFTRKGDASRHSRTVHGDIKMLCCGVCNKKFSDSKHLAFHLQNHDKMFSYVCAKCGFKFGKKEYFENHIRYIHPSVKGQSSMALNDAVSREKKDIEGLKLKNSKPTDLYLPENIDEIGKEDINKCLYNLDSNLKKVSENSSFSCKYPLLNNKDGNNQVHHETNLEKKETLSFSSKFRCETSSDHCKKDEDLVNFAIKSAISQAKCTLEKLSTINNFSLTLNNIINESLKSKTTKKIAKNEFGFPEIHITAKFDGVMRKFIIYIPVKNLNPDCKEELNFIEKIVNHTCSGKGKINGPVEFEIRQT